MSRDFWMQMKACWDDQFLPWEMSRAKGRNQMGVEFLFFHFHLSIFLFHSMDSWEQNHQLDNTFWDVHHKSSNI